MSKFFTTITALLLLVGAAAHGYRLYKPFEIIIAGHSIPLWASWPAAGVTALLGLMVLVESRR